MAAFLLASALLAPGCASLPDAFSRTPGIEDLGREIRPEAPPE